jgi:hypothetical protein
MAEYRRMNMCKNRENLTAVDAIKYRLQNPHGPLLTRVNFASEEQYLLYQYFLCRQLSELLERSAFQYLTKLAVSFPKSPIGDSYEAMKNCFNSFSGNVSDNFQRDVIITALKKDL